MILNLLNESEGCLIEKRSDVCIVGAGTAGIYLAQALRKKNLNVILVELGGVKTNLADLVFEKPNFSLDEYRGASLGRVSGIGGTSSKWGGQMISLNDSDFIKKENLMGDLSWPISKVSLQSYFKRVANTLKISDPKGYDFSKNKTNKLVARSKVSKFFKLRASTWIPFSKRNFAKGFDQDLRVSKGLEVWLNAGLSSIDDAEWEGQVLTKLNFRGLDNRILSVSSEIFVYTMGALESTKHVLQLIGKNRPNYTITTPFCDHISTSVGYVKVKKRLLFYDYFSPFYVNGVMKSLRFELNASTQDALNTGSAFIHFATAQKQGSALDLLRNVARKFQGEPINISLGKINIWSIFRDLWIILFWRIFKKKLLLNYNGPIEILVDIEQMPNLENRISVKAGSLKLHWSVGDEEKSTVKKTAEVFKDTWNLSKELSDIAEIIILPDTELNKANYYDVYHPTGSLPFGTEQRDSVLDPNLRVWDANNLYVSSTAIFPTGGSANPGFTHLALTERLADHIEIELSKT